MTDPDKPLPEPHYARLFPNQPIPAWALDKMELIEEYKFTIGPGRVERVALAQVVGTNDASYGNSLRWLDMLTRGRKSFNFWENNWPGFLDADTSEVELVRIAGTDEYYIYGEGNHRISACKLAGKPFLQCLVKVAHPKLSTDDIPIRLINPG